MLLKKILPGMLVLGGLFGSTLSLAEVNRCDEKLKPICGKMDEIIQPSKLLGASIAIKSKDGKIHYATFNKTPEGDPITPDMKFEIGSITKTFTAARIIQLIEEGKLDYHSSLMDVIPPSELFYYNELPGNLTMEHLLSMENGLYDYVSSYRVITRDLSAFWPMRNMTSSGYLPDKYQHKLGESCYGSTGTLLLGLVIDKLHGGNGLGKEPLVSALREGLLKPAGLNNTFMGGYEDAYPISSCTNSHHFDHVENTPPKRCAHPDSFMHTGNSTEFNDSPNAFLSFAGPAGGMISTSEDLANWFSWLFTKGPGMKMVERTRLLGERRTEKDPFITWSKCNQTPWPYADSALKKMEMGRTMEVATYEYDGKPVTVYGFMGGSLSFGSYGIYLPQYETSAAILLNNINNPTDTFEYSTTVQISMLTGLIIEHIIGKHK